MDRSVDWYKQAERDLGHAKRSFEMGDYEWACFASHQSAEKALKALHYYFKQEAWGHSLSRLLKDLPIEIPEELLDLARVLDLYYIPTRYPNGFPEGAPFEHFTERQAREAIDYASKVLEFVRLQMGL